MVVDFSKMTEETIEKMVKENAGGIWKGWKYTQNQKWSPFAGNFNDVEIIEYHIIHNLPKMSEREIEELWIYGWVKLDR